MHLSRNPSQPPGPLPQGEYPFTISDFRHLAAILKADVGIMVTDAKAPLVYGRLVKRLRALGLESFRAYCALVASDAGAEERKQMMAALTTNVTRFFREPHHFEHLKREVLPGLITRAKRGRRVRIWSAGCSTGEEPYSIALTILQMLPDAVRHDLKILATDVNVHVLARAREGAYVDAVTEDIDEAVRERWFTPTTVGRGLAAWQVAEPLRKLVAFRELNLIQDWPMSGQFDVIFCRNTVIYFDEEAQADIWSRMSRITNVGGHLYIGHSERVTGQTQYRPVGLTTYQRVEAD